MSRGETGICALGVGLDKSTCSANSRRMALTEEIPKELSPAAGSIE